MAELSTKPYLIRAIHQWCEDSGFRPYLAVAVDERTIVPREFVRNGEIVLNVSSVATNRLMIGNELIEFEARFSGAVREVSIPIDNVSAIYAQETGHGMAFDVPKPLAIVPEPGRPNAAKETSPHERAASRPKLVPRSRPNAESAPAQLASQTEPSEGGAALALAAVKTASDEERPKNSRAPSNRGGRRRGKLSAVPAASSELAAPGDAETSPAVADASHQTLPTGEAHAQPADSSAVQPSPPEDPSPVGGGGRPKLKRVK